MNPIRKLWEASWPWRKRLGLVRKRPHPLLSSDLTQAERDALYESFVAVKPRTYLEIGVYWGGSFRRVLEHRNELGLKTHCIGLDLWDEVQDWAVNTHAGDRPNRKLVGNALRKAKLDNFTLLAGTSADLKTLVPGTVEMAFQDANHTYAAVIEDMARIREILVPGGRLLVHNASLDMKPDRNYVAQDGGPHRAVTEQSQNGNWELLEIRDRMAVLRKPEA